VLFLVLRKILSHKGLIACLLVGCILAVAMICIIPLYTDGILQRLLRKDMQVFQEQYRAYPGQYTFTTDLTYNTKSGFEEYLYYDTVIKEELAEELHMQAKDSSTLLSVKNLRFQKIGSDTTRYTPTTLMTISGYEDHLKLVAGEWPKPGLVDGCYEVLVQPSAQTSLGVVIGGEYNVTGYSGTLSTPMPVRVVGLYEQASETDGWWPEVYITYANCLFMDYGTMRSDVVLSQRLLTVCMWNFCMDYYTLPIDSVQGALDTIDEHTQWFATPNGNKVSFRAQTVLESYAAREKQLKTTLWVLEIPIMMMLAFYIYMVAQLIVQSDANEIAMLQSRGAGTSQILMTYFLQSLLLCGTAAVLGPLVGVFFCTLLGAANGFLEFVGRTALPIVIRPQTFLYDAIAFVFAMTTMMLPAFVASRVTIVEKKQSNNRRWRAPLWQKLFLDVIFLALALYGLYSYGVRQTTVMVTAAEGLSVPVDPYLFLISTLFLLGAGLVFLRVYPYFLRLIFWLGRRYWSSSMYSTFLTVIRSSGRETFLMLFLILTVSIGIYFGNAARTINKNLEDRANYSVGTDIVMTREWVTTATVTDGDSYTVYVEPDFSETTRIEGIQNAARVIYKTLASTRHQSTTQSTVGQNITATVMAFDPLEFSKVVWYDSALLPYHINEYLNYMNRSTTAIILSASYRDDFGLKVGDTLSYSWKDLDGKTCGTVYGTIMAFVEYWPGINPNTEEGEYFVIGNYNYVRLQTRLQPYQYWLKMEEDAGTAEVYEAIAQKNYTVKSIVNARQDIISQKNDALLQGTNGSLTMGFIVTMMIAMVGFLLYWIISIRSRELQFGILRAIGLTRERVWVMLIWEQALLSAAAILAGIMIGSIASQLYVPMLEMVYSAAQQVPPFKVVASRTDYIRIYCVVGFMLAAGFAVLGALISRIRITQAIKLGED